MSDSLPPHGLRHARLPCPSLSPSLLKLMFIKSMMPSNHLILFCPLLLPSVSPSIRIFSSEPALHIRWPKYWSSSFSISPSDVYSGLISFRIDWFDLLAVRGMITVSLIREGKLSAEQKVREVPFLWDRGPGENEMLGAA